MINPCLVEGLTLYVADAVEVSEDDAVAATVVDKLQVLVTVALSVSETDGVADEVWVAELLDGFKLG